MLLFLLLLERLNSCIDIHNDLLSIDGNFIQAFHLSCRTIIPNCVVCFNTMMIVQVRAILLDPSCSGSGISTERLDHLLPSHSIGNYMLWRLLLRHICTSRIQYENFGICIVCSYNIEFILVFIPH